MISNTLQIVLRTEFNYTRANSFGTWSMVGRVTDFELENQA